MNRRTWGWVAVAAGIVIGGGIVLWRVIDRRPRDRPGETRETATTQPTITAPRPRSRPTTFPAAREWRSQHSYVGDRGQLVSNYNIDADNSYDRNEIVSYGTLRHDTRTRAKEPPRINLPKPWVNPEDTDGDRLLDAWELGYFGTLKYGPDDDPDGDGYPNSVEYGQLMSPVTINLKNPKTKPKKFPPATVRRLSPRRSFSTQSLEFWEAQEKAAKRVAAGDTGPAPAVKGFKWRRLKPKPLPPPPPKPSPLRLRFARLGRSALGPARDSDADGLADEWEKHYFGNLAQTRQDDPDGDGFPNVIEWYRLTDPTKVDLMDLRFKPAKLEDLPPPTTPWDHCWDIHSREFWEIQERFRARVKSQKPSLSIRPAGELQGN